MDLMLLISALVCLNPKTEICLGFNNATHEGAAGQMKWQREQPRACHCHCASAGDLQVSRSLFIPSEGRIYFNSYPAPQDFLPRKDYFLILLSDLHLGSGAKIHL